MDQSRIGNESLKSNSIEFGTNSIKDPGIFLTDWSEKTWDIGQRVLKFEMLF